MLILYDKKGHEEKRLGVDKWNTDTLKEYLTEVLSWTMKTKTDFMKKKLCVFFVCFHLLIDPE